MYGRDQVQKIPMQHSGAPSFLPAQIGLLQRKCACGTHTIAGECESCQKEKPFVKLQRAATNAEPVNEVPPIVHDVLRSPGQPLDARTRSFFEPRFGYDFSRVRVHTDARAAESARAVGAQAYTVGADVAFAPGQFAPDTGAGKKLLAHELTHTIQQGSGAFGFQRELEVGKSNDSAEAEAEIISENILSGNDAARPVRQTTAHVARQPAAAPAAAASPAATPKQAAINELVAQQRRVAILIQDGLKPVPGAGGVRDMPTLFHNSCQWIQTGKASMVVLSRTHDSATRKAGFHAYFDKQVKYPATGGDYAEQPSAGDTANIVYAPPDWLGGMQGHELTLIDTASQSNDGLKSTIVHEVQHDADQSTWMRTLEPPPGRVEGSPGRTGADALGSASRYNNYQSEFRAYWIGTEEGSPQDHLGSSKNPATNNRPVTWTNPQGRAFSQATNFKNERQEKIFRHLLRSYDWLQIPETYTQDAAYRSMVDSFAQPVGLNLVNSTRIQELSEALKKCDPSMDASAPEIQKLLGKANVLDITDRAFLIDRASSERFWTQARRALSRKMFEELERNIDPALAVPRPVPARPKFAPLYQPRTNFTDKMIRDVEGL